ncbi:MAG: sigma-54 dependent transcriptional regulator [Polyangiaceae bacterium]
MILVVDDEPAIRLAIGAVLKKQGHTVTSAKDYEEAARAIEADALDLVLTDVALGGAKTGLDVLAHARARQPETPVILITAHGNEKLAVQAMKAGATDYLPKPFDNDELRLVVERALAETRLAREHRLLLERAERETSFGNLVGAGPAMRRVFETIRKVAATDLTVLVRGESGTGKELVAAALHDRSPRKGRPFVAVNSAAMSRELVESELFGHERGAFTGADARRIGRFEQADGGTLFLDEIGDMPLETQAKVLRVLEERRFERVGGAAPVRVDVRVVAATHRDLESDVAAGRFRQDLYYRLKVVEIALPPLCDRLEDIPLLAARLLAKAAARSGSGAPPATLSAAALARLARHGFPGNVRELRNVLERAAALSNGTIETEDLGLDPTLEVRGPAPASNLPFAEAKRHHVEAFERAYLVAALERHGGNVSRTADAIGMVRQSLQQKLRELGIKPRG